MSSYLKFFLLFGSSAGDHISVSNPEGNFIKLQVEDVEELLLLAGGTGFTPMVKLLNYALTSSNTLRYLSDL